MLNVKEILKATNGKLINGDLEIEVKDYQIDSREVKKDDFYIPLIGEKVDGHKFIIDVVKNGAIGFFTSEDINLNEILEINKNIVIIQVNDTLQALQEIGIYNRKKCKNVEVIGITGSVGKTSTREMVASVLSQEKNIMVTQKNMNGHIGLPIMALQLKDQDIAVLEAGIDFIGEMDILNKILLADVAIVTNIGTSHIGKLGSRENIFNEKIKIANNLVGKKTILLNNDDEYLKEYTNSNVNIIRYSINDAENINYFQDRIEFDTCIYNKKEHITINAIGNHNILNAIIAVKIAEIYNIPSEKIIKGVANYRNFTRRMEIVKLKDITLIDDTYNASPSSTESGLKTVDKLKAKRKLAVLADILELGDYAEKLHRNLGKIFENLNYDMLIVYGDNMEYLADVAKAYVNEVYCCNGYKEAEELLKSKMQKDDLIYFKGSNAMDVNKIVEDLKKDFMN